MLNHPKHCGGVQGLRKTMGMNQVKRCILSATMLKHMLLKKKGRQQKQARLANFTSCLNRGLHIKDLCQDDSVTEEEGTNK